MSRAAALPIQPAWVRPANAALCVLTLLVIVPVGLLALVMVQFLTEPGHPAASTANIFVLSWSILASIISALHLILAGVGIARPKRSGTLRMIAASILILITCPVLWTALLGLL